MGKALMNVLVLLILFCKSEEWFSDGVLFVLGGSWYEEITVVKKGGYLRTEYKEEVLDPVID